MTTAPDLIVHAGTVHTMAPATGATDSAAGPVAIAVTEARITAIGPASEIDPSATSATEIIDLDGTLVPAFTDAHSHPVMALSMARGADLSAATSLAEVSAALRAEAKRVDATATAADGMDRATTSADGSEWVLGWGLDPNIFPDATITGAVLDEALGADRPAYVSLFDAHSAIASAAALRIAGIEGGRTWDSGSAIVTDEDGLPTGHLLEFEAMAEVQAHLPVRTIEEKVAALHELLSAMAAAGIGTVHAMDMNDPDGLELLAAAEARAPLPVRLRISPWCVPTVTDAEVAELVSKQSLSGQRWSVGGVKFFIDGTIEGGTAWLETPDTKGENTESAWGGIEGYAARIRQLNAAGVPTATHAIGERGIREVAETLAALPDTGVRHRIEHIESVPRSVLELMGRAGIAASMQPTHCTHYTKADGSDEWSIRLGEVRAHRAWCIRDAIDAGATLALGSDFPVVPYPVLPIMADAQLRRPLEDPTAAPVLPEQAITAAEALAGYTTGPHRAIGEEGGFLAVGQPATFTVLDVDPLAVSAEELGAGHVLLTVSEGLITHRESKRSV